MQTGTVRRSLEQRQSEELLAGAGDACYMQLALPLCSFTGLACVDSGSSCRCTFYWIDGNRGLLGRGLIDLSDKTAQQTQPLSPGTVVPRLIGLTSARRQRRRSVEPDANCSMEVLVTGLKKPLRVTVAPGKAYRRFVFYTEAGAAVADLGISTRLIEDASLSVYDAEAEETRVLASGLCDVRGLQVTPSLDVVFMARPGPASSDLHVYVVRALDCLTKPQAKGGGAERVRLLTLCEKPRFGHGTKHEDVALLPNGVVVVAVRIADSEGGADTGATGAVHAYLPNGHQQQLPACHLPWPPPPPEKPWVERDRRHFDYEDYVRQYLDWRAKHRPPTPPPPPEEPVMPVVVSTPPTPVKPGDKRKLSNVPPGTDKPRKPSTSPPPQGAGGGKPAVSPAGGKGKGKASNSAAATLSSSGKGGRDGHHPPSVQTVATVVTVVAKTPTMRRRSKDKTLQLTAGLRPPVTIPPLDLPPPDDRFFHLGVPPPPSTARALRSRFQPCLSPLLALEQLLTAGYAATPLPLATDLPVTRMLAFSPVTLRLVLGCCGAGPDGQSAALGELEPWAALAGEGPPSPRDSAFRPLVGGFMVCVAMDDYGTVLLRTARADGQLMVLWGRSSGAWRQLRLAEAAAVPLPSTPRPRHTQAEPSAETAAQQASSVPVETAVVEEVVKQEVVKPLDGKVAEWSKGLVAGLPDEEAKHRRHTHINNTFTDSGRVNTLVVLRCRPLLAEEKEAGAESCLSCTKNDVTVDGSFLPLRHKRTFHFDRVFDDAARQVDVYLEVVAPVVHRVLQGYSCTVFAYGQTGSGKTFTMEGSMDDGERAGIIPRSIYQIFSELTKLPNATYRVKVSHVEIYNEQLHDLLKSHRRQAEDGGAEEKLRIEEGPNRRIRLRGAREIPVRSPHNIFQILHKSIKNRHTAETRCNRQSSRSHGIFTVRVRCSYVHAEEGEITFEGSLNLVDLSGSENIKRSGAQGLRAREAGTIGQSLLAFSRVITGLVNTEAHIPYRDSKLTHLLADSLGGKSYTTIILNVTPHARMLDETMNTLNYASLARNVYSKPKQSLQRRDAAGQAAGPEVGGVTRGVACADAPPVRPWEGGVPMRRAAWRFLGQDLGTAAHHNNNTYNTATWPASGRPRVDHVYHSQALEWVQSAVLEADRQHLRREAVRALTDIFRSYDGNHDGVLVLSEVKRMHKAWVPDTLAPDLLDAWTPPAARLRTLTRATLPCKQFLAFSLEVARKDPLFLLHIIRTAGYGLGLLSTTMGLAEVGEAAGGEGTPIELLLYHNTPRPNTKTQRKDGSGGGLLSSSAAGPVTSGFVNPAELFDYLEPYVKPTREDRKQVPARPQSAGPAAQRAAAPIKQRPRIAVPMPPPVPLSRQVSNESVVTLESLDQDDDDEDSVTLASFLSDDDDLLSDSSFGGSPVASPIGSPAVGTPVIAIKRAGLAGGLQRKAQRPQSAPASRRSRSVSAGGKRGGNRPSLSPVRPTPLRQTSSPAFTPKPYHTSRPPSRGGSPVIQPQVFFSSGMTTPIVRVPLCEWCSHKVVPGTLHSVAFCPEHA